METKYSISFRHCDIYDKNKEKHITPKWLNLPLEKIKFIVKGLIDTDGCKGNELLFDTTSHNLLESLRYALTRMVFRQVDIVETEEVKVIFLCMEIE